MRRMWTCKQGMIHVPGVPNGMGAVLFCSGWQPECLEIYTYGEERWDGVYNGFSIEGQRMGLRRAAEPPSRQERRDGRWTLPCDRAGQKMPTLAARSATRPSRR